MMHSLRKKYFPRAASRQTGVALVQVLLVFAILVTIAAQLGFRQRLTISGTQEMLERGQARAWLYSVEALALAELSRDYESPLPEEYWGEWSDVFDLDPGEATFKLQTLENRYNLNWLHPESGVEEAPAQVTRLLQNQGADTAWVQRLNDWFDRESGAEFEYRVVEPGYRPSFQPLVDASELRLLMPQVIPLSELALDDWATFLPPDSQIYLPSISRALFNALHADLGDEHWAALEAALADGMEAPEDWLAAEVMEPLQGQIPTGWFTLQKQYFLLEAEVTYLNYTLWITSWIYRDPDGNMQVYQRHFIPMDTPPKPEEDETDDE
ncbi:MAG: hypothetical protein WEB07_00125 [Natronospirillum sp.]